MAADESATNQSKEEKPERLLRTYKAVVQLENPALQKVLFLSRILIHLWNMGITEAERWLETKERGITRNSFNYWLTAARKTAITLEDGTLVPLADVSSDVEREVLRKLAGSYKSFFELKKNRDTRARKPTEKQEPWFQTISWSSFKIVGDKLMVPGYQQDQIEISLKGRDKRTGRFTKGYLETKIQGKKVTFVTLSRDRMTGDFILSLVTAKPMPEIEEQPDQNRPTRIFRAIDLGAGDIAVSDSDGREYLIPTRRPDKMWMDRIAEVEARQERRKKGSRAWKKLATARRYMHNRSGAQKDDHQKKVAHALISPDVQCIIVGKSKTRLGLARTENASPAQHYGAQNTGYLFRMFLYLRNKAEERGVKFIELPDPRREGSLENPEYKFRASRQLLKDGLVKTGNKNLLPSSFERARFSINFGR
jgi:transposase